MSGVFLMNFAFTTAVSIAKIFVKFNTQRKYRVLVALNFVHLLSFVNLLTITVLRFNHTGKVCFCHYSDLDQDKCMDKSEGYVEIYIFGLWGILFFLTIGVCFFFCCAFCQH